MSLIQFNTPLLNKTINSFKKNKKILLILIHMTRQELHPRNVKWNYELFPKTEAMHYLLFMTFSAVI